MRIIFILFVPLIIIIALLFSAFAVSAQEGVLPDCDPAAPPKNGGCGLESFIELVQNLINLFLFYIAAPAAGLMLVWGGFVIMTSGGSQTRFQKGKNIIIAAIVGVAIAFGVWLIIQLVYLLAGVENADYIPR